MQADFKVALQRMVRLASEMELEIKTVSKKKKTNPGPLLYVMALARRKAAEALASLADADPGDAKAIQALQNEIQLFKNLVQFVTDTMRAGDEAMAELHPEEQAELMELLDQEEGGVAATGED